MQDFSCSKCGSVDVYIDDRGSQKALMCKDCGSWLKWVGKKEMPLVIQYIRKHRHSEDKHNVFIEKSFYDFEIELLIKMCSKCLSDNSFSELEKENIQNILDNTLV